MTSRSSRTATPPPQAMGPSGRAATEPLSPLLSLPGSAGRAAPKTPPGGTHAAADVSPGGSRAVTMTEAQLESQVRTILKDVTALAPDGDVLGYHTYFSKASHAGFPDWVFAGPAGILFRELKTAKGRLSLAQVMWRRVLRQAGADVDVWRPEDLLSGRVARELAAMAGLRTGAA